MSPEQMLDEQLIHCHTTFSNKIEKERKKKECATGLQKR